jgi:hypothetical protein
MTIGRAESLGKLDRLVDDHPVGNVGPRQQLPDSEVKNRMLDGIQPRRSDVRMSLQLLVEPCRLVANCRECRTEVFRIGPQNDGSALYFGATPALLAASC